MSTYMSPLGLYSSNNLGIPSSFWILDSNASHNTLHSLLCFASLPPGYHIHVMSFNATSMHVDGIGNVINRHISYILKDLVCSTIILK